MSCVWKVGQLQSVYAWKLAQADLKEGLVPVDMWKTGSTSHNIYMSVYVCVPNTFFHGKVPCDNSNSLKLLETGMLSVSERNSPPLLVTAED